MWEWAHDRATQNNSSVASLFRSAEKNTQRLDMLEIVYFDMKNEEKRPETGKPKNMFDKIQDSVVDNAATCRKQERENFIQMEV